MKRLLLCLLFTLPLVAQTPPRFNHIIIVIQENRTPDNLFASCPPPGADITPIGQPMSLGHITGLAHSHYMFHKEQAGNWPALAKNYVQFSDVVPYCQLAAQYGFADRMFQTNQGPSFPAHQFLISGTSSLDDQTHVLASEGPLHVGGKNGCNTPPGATVQTINDQGKYGEAYPCFSRSSILNLLDAEGLTWRYYASNGLQTLYWNAPAALRSYYQASNIVLKPSQVLTDISSCQLANVSWVTPTWLTSDHGGKGSGGGGPAWVASIVNAVSGSSCQYWQDTAIILTWDDWGGWWDHVPPPVNHTGWAPEYVYGFRVPLIAISAYTPAMVDHSMHDFGSILRFVESNFGLSLVGPGTWADAYADDLSVFFPGPQREPRQIRARKLTERELNSQGDPDDY